MFGATQLLTGGGSDTLTLSGASRYQARVWINMAGAGADNDTLAITPAVEGEEMLMLKGLSVVSGPGLDVLNGGNGAGILRVHNGVAAPLTLIRGVNFLTV